MNQSEPGIWSVIGSLEKCTFLFFYCMIRVDGGFKLNIWLWCLYSHKIDETLVALYYHVVFATCFLQSFYNDYIIYKI